MKRHVDFAVAKPPSPWLALHTKAHTRWAIIIWSDFCREVEKRLLLACNRYGIDWQPRPQFMAFNQALKLLPRDDRFRATVYAMNTLLIQKGIYTHEEFERLFVEWVAKERRCRR